MARAPGPSGPLPSILDAIPDGLPALTHARKLTERASLVGFDWPEAGPVWDKIQEEIGELRDAVEENEGHERVQAELGDILLACTNVSRFLGVDPQQALEDAIARFTSRFQAMERELAAQGLAMEDQPLDELEELWQAVKRQRREPREPFGSVRGHGAETGAAIDNPPPVDPASGAE